MKGRYIYAISANPGIFEITLKSTLNLSLSSVEYPLNLAYVFIVCCKLGNVECCIKFTQTLTILTNGNAEVQV